MSKDRDDKLNNSPEYSLEEILAEFGSGKTPFSPPETSDGAEEPGNVVLFPGTLGEAKRSPEPPPAPAEPPAREEISPETGPTAAEKPSESAVPKKGAGKKSASPSRILPFPGEDAPPLQKGLNQLRKKADEYAGRMFEEEGIEDSEETRRAEELIPGVDEEEPEQHPLRERKPRREPEPPPDLPPAQLAARYGKGLRLLRLRTILVFLLTLPLLWLSMAPFFGLPLPGALGTSFPLRVWCSGGLLSVALILGIDIPLRGLAQLVFLRPGPETAVTLAAVMTLADAFTQIQRMPDRETLPYCVAAVLSLFFCMWGEYVTRQGLRISCRTAAAATTPYLVTLDPKAWNGREAYAKWLGAPHGFGSQVQEEDGARKIFRYSVPLFLLGSLLCSLIASVGQGHPERIFWCLSATLTASSSLSALLIFSRPYRALSRRLASCGAALAGWPGAEKAGSAILLTDTDLFPPGLVSLNGIKVFGDFSVEKAVAVCATLIRESGSGLDRIFHDLLRAQGAVYRRCREFQRHEGGGLSAEIRGEQVLVGSASFMTLMEVPMPQGLNVRNAVFCAVNGELAGIFALNYVLHGAVPPALSALIGARVSPVLCTRDFNLIPALLKQKFKLPVEKMHYPPVERRTELSDPGALHSPRLVAVLCREGLAPFSEAVVGARRLRLAVRLAATVSLVGSVAGLLLAFYLTFLAAWSSITAAQMVVFLLAWLVPTLLISGWVNRY